MPNWNENCRAQQGAPGGINLETAFLSFWSNFPQCLYQVTTKEEVNNAHKAMGLKGKAMTIDILAPKATGINKQN